MTVYSREGTAKKPGLSNTVGTVFLFCILALAVPLMRGLAQAQEQRDVIELSTEYNVDGHPILSSYVCSSVEDLALGKRIGLNLILGDHEHLDPTTPEGEYCARNGIKVVYHLTRHLYGMPRLGQAITAEQTTVPLSTIEGRALKAPGVIQIEDELIRFEQYTPGALLECRRGYQGTTPAAHHEGIILFEPERCADDVAEVKDSPNLWGYYVLDDSPGDALSALRGMYKVIERVDGGSNHHPVLAGYGSAGSLTNFAPGVCDMMMIYWYPQSDRTYYRYMISHEVQWMLTTARARVPGIPFLGVYQTFWGSGAGERPPTPEMIREQTEDFVREGACGLLAFAGHLGDPSVGWTGSESMQQAMKSVHEEILATGGLRVAPQPERMARERIQPVGAWDTPLRIPGIVPAWHLIGPFGDPDQARLDAAFPPEKEMDLDAVYDGKFGPVRWVKRNTQAAVVGLGELYGFHKHLVDSAAYATATVKSPKQQEVRLSIGTDDDAVVWLNGQEIFRHEGMRGVKRDQDAVNVTLPEGDSRLMIKIYNRAGMWAFSMRFLDLGGDPLDGLSFSPTEG